MLQMGRKKDGVTDLERALGLENQAGSGILDEVKTLLEQNREP